MTTYNTHPQTRNAERSKPFAPLRELFAERHTAKRTLRKAPILRSRYLALCVLLSAMLTVFASGPSIEFPETSKSLGTFRLDLIQTTDFEFVNTGDEPLLILNVNTDCGCTDAGYPKDEILPGDTAKISVRYNGRNNPTGTFRKQVRGRSNDPEHPMVRLFIKGKAIKG